MTTEVRLLQKYCWEENNYVHFCGKNNNSQSFGTSILVSTELTIKKHVGKYSLLIIERSILPLVVLVRCCYCKCTSFKGY